MCFRIKFLALFFSLEICLVLRKSLKPLYVPEKPSTCKEKGWDSYKTCDDWIDHVLSNFHSKKYVFVVDTTTDKTGIAKVICDKWVIESHAGYGKREKELLTGDGIKAALAGAGLRRPYMRKLFLGTCGVFIGTKHTDLE